MFIRLATLVRVSFYPELNNLRQFVPNSRVISPSMVCTYQFPVGRSQRKDLHHLHVADDTVELLITHSLIWEFKGLFNSKFPNSIMHYEQFDCTRVE